MGLRPAPVPTVIGADTVIHGHVRGTGQYVVSGEIHGDGELSGALLLSAAARWYGKILAHQAVIAGRIEGALIVRDHLEIGATAVLRGRVSARTIAIARGAVVDGEIEITSGIAAVEFDEKRDP